MRCNKARGPFIAHHGKAIGECRLSAAALQAMRFVFSSLWTIGGQRQDLRHTATGISRTAFASSDGLKNRCASASVRTWKNWMISRQGPQWKAMRGTSVFVISPEQRGQSGFMEVLESCRGYNARKHRYVRYRNATRIRLAQRPGFARWVAQS